MSIIQHFKSLPAGAVLQEEWMSDNWLSTNDLQVFIAAHEALLTAAKDLLDPSSAVSVGAARHNLRLAIEECEKL